jgi:hypothetical protein
MASKFYSSPAVPDMPADGNIKIYLLKKFNSISTIAIIRNEKGQA